MKDEKHKETLTTVIFHERLKFLSLTMITT